MTIDNPPEFREKSRDPIRGTGQVRVIMQHVCPECGTDLELQDREMWIRDCPECEYSWQPSETEQATL